MITNDKKVEAMDWLASIRESFSVGQPDYENPGLDAFEIVIRTTEAKALSDRGALKNFIEVMTAQQERNAPWTV